MARNHGLRRRPGERRLAGQHFVEHTSQRVDIAASVELLLAGGLLRAHVQGGTEGEGARGNGGFSRHFDGAGNTEVQDDGALFGQHNVFRLDISVDVPAFVGVIEGTRYIGGDLEGVLQRKLSLTGQPAAEAFALDQRHGVEQVLALTAGIQERDDVGVGKRSRDRDLALKPIGAEQGGYIRAQKLYGDGPAQTQIPSPEHRALATRSQLILELITVAERVLKVCQGLHRPLLRGATLAYGSVPGSSRLNEGGGVPVNFPLLGCNLYSLGHV